MGGYDLRASCLRKLGVLSYLVHILASKEENGLVAAALWALLQLAAEDPLNQKVALSAAASASGLVALFKEARIYPRACYTVSVGIHAMKGALKTPLRSKRAALADLCKEISIVVYVGT